MIVNSEKTWAQFQAAFDANDLVVICGGLFYVVRMESNVTSSGIIRDVTLIEVIPI
jgi:hypothetical protein